MSETTTSNGTRIFTGQLFRLRRGSRYDFVDQEPVVRGPVTRPARVAQILALAHRLQDAIARGEYKDRAEVARQLGLTRARITQLMDLLLLAPDIQEEVLGSEAVNGIEPISERALRPITRELLWANQRTRWAQLTPAK